MRIASNLINDRPWTENVGRDMFAGALIGITLGASTGAVLAGGSVAATAAASDHIVLGLAAHGVARVASQVGGRTLLSDPNWRQSVQTAIANQGTKITLNLDGLAGSSAYSKIMSAAQQGLGRNASPTNWEIGQLVQSGRINSVQLIEGGRAVANPFVQR